MTPKQTAVDLMELARRVMVDHGFDIELDAADLSELASVMEGLRDLEERRDMRELLWSSIDNHDSQDLDQVEYAERLDGGRLRLYIGIADVDACAEKDHRIDKFAATNGTSVYTGVVVFPMLPEALSNDRTSLLPNQDREAMVMQLDIAENGDIAHFEVYFAIVRNHAKLVYEKVARWLKGEYEYRILKEIPQLEEQLRLQEEMCLRLRAANERHGAISVQTVEARPVSNNGVVVDLEIVETNRARDIVQSFMTAANSSLARFMKESNTAIIQRIVKKPERWPRIVKLAAEYGATLPEEPDAVALSQFIAQRRIASPETFSEFSLTIVKLLGPGQYVVHVPGQPADGHFGLAVHDYTHATAPNRRYADLVLQRIVKSVLRKEPHPYSLDELENIADRCKDRENAARKVERITRKAAAAVLLSPRIGDTFNAIVTGASSKGVYVRLFKPPAEGRVVANESGLEVGDRVQVRLVATNYLQGFIDFERV